MAAGAWPAMLLLAMACAACSGNDSQIKAAPMREIAIPEDSVSARLVALDAGVRHPQSIWTFHISLHNPLDEPLWFVWLGVLGEPLDTIKAATGARLDTVPSAQGAVPVVRLIASHEVIGFRLPPGGRLEIAQMPLDCWYEKGASELEIWALRDIEVAGRPLDRSWLQGHAITAPQTAHVERFAAPHAVYKHLQPDLDDVAVDLRAVRRWRFAIDRGAMPLPWEDSAPPANWPGDGAEPAIEP